MATDQQRERLSLGIGAALGSNHDTVRLDLGEREACLDACGFRDRHLVGSSPDDFTLDLWVEQGAELAPIVILISAAADRQMLIDGLAIPALEAIEIEPI